MFGGVLTIIFTVVVPVLAALAILAAVYFAFQAVRDRSRTSRLPYNVGRQESHKAARVNVIRSGLALLFALVMLLVFGVGIVSVNNAPPVSEPPLVEPTAVGGTAVAPTIAATATPAATPTSEATPTSPVPTPTATPLPTPTSTPEPPSATVSSGVGVWLRSAPSTTAEQLEWLLDGTVLLVLSGRETVEEIEWQQVQTASGTVGWVAAEFIVIE